MLKLLDGMSNVNNIINVNRIIKNVKTQSYHIIVKLLVGSAINDTCFILASAFFYMASIKDDSQERHILNLVGFALLIIPFVRLITELQRVKAF